MLGRFCQTKLEMPFPNLALPRLRPSPSATGARGAGGFPAGLSGCSGFHHPRPQMPWRGALTAPPAPRIRSRQHVQGTAEGEGSLCPPIPSALSTRERVGNTVPSQLDRFGVLTAQETNFSSIAF